MPQLLTTSLIITCLLTQAIEPIVIKMALGKGFQLFDLLVYRFVAGGLIVLPFCYQFKWVGWTRFKQLLPVCLLFLAVNSFTYMALQSLSAITVITFVTTTPAFVAIINQKRGKEELGSTFWPGFFLCFFGVLLTVEAFTQGWSHLSPQGIFFISLAVLGSTLYRTTMDSVTKNFGPLLTSNYIFLTNGLIMVWAIPWTSTHGFTALPWGLWTGFSAVLANVAFLWAIKVLGSTKVSLWTILQRPILFILSAIFLKEAVGWQQIVGIVMVISGIQMAKVVRKT